jgi:hypothetical protein
LLLSEKSQEPDFSPDTKSFISYRGRAALFFPVLPVFNSFNIHIFSELVLNSNKVYEKSLNKKIEENLFNSPADTHMKTGS